MILLLFANPGKRPADMKNSAMKSSFLFQSFRLRTALTLISCSSFINKAFSAGANSISRQAFRYTWLIDCFIAQILVLFLPMLLILCPDAPGGAKPSHPSEYARP